MEGELNFPLADKQRVFRFAMDLNGKLRESVVVEKQLGRRAFEGVVRQEIDPALLEMTVGNNYKARVYPIPAKGRKIILIGYEEELQDSKAPLYQLNLKYGKVTEFDLNVEVINQKEKPTIKQNELSNFSFKEWKNAFIVEAKEKDFKATGIFSFEIPTQINEQIFREKNVEQENNTNTENDYFYINLIPNVIQKEKVIPSSIVVLWDVSASSKERNTEKEIKLLENYLKEISQKQSTTSSQIELLLFNNKIVSQDNFLINQSNFESEIVKITKQLENIIYDGGTDLKAINFPKLQQEEILLFSDGISNLSHSETAFPIKKDNSQTIYTIVSSGTNNAPFLNSLAQKTGGNYINLSYETQKEALEALLSQNYQFLGVKYKNKLMSEVYPSTPQTLQKDKTFSLTGKINSTKKSRDAQIEIQFGIGKQILETRKITIPKTYNSTSIKRLWANKKIDELSLNAKQNKNEIIKVAKEYNMITPYTSLIVLDRIEDYVRYEIVPPTELKEEYDKLLAQKIQKIANTEIEFIKEALTEYEEKIEWWTEDRKDIKVEKKPTNTTETQQETEEQKEQQEVENEIEEETKEETTEQIKEETNGQENNINDKSNNETQQETANSSSQNTSIPIDKSEVEKYERLVTITGTVSSHDGNLPGATVQIKGTTIGTQTDIDGKYSIICSPEDVLVFMFVGYNSKEVRVGNQSVIDQSLYGNSLESVVVTSFAVEKEKASLNYSIAGKVSGVQINSSAGTPGAASQIVIRGNSSINLNQEPLYVIDGVIVTESDYKQINPEQIKSVSVLKNEHATAIYGSRGAGGVVLIVTKEAAQKGYVLPDSTQNQLQIQQEKTTKLIIKEWDSDEPYMDSIKNATKENRFQTYLSLKKSYSSTPSFFLSIGTYFIQNGEQDLGLQILSNVVELELENYELLKMLGYKYSELGKMETAIFLFEKVNEIRPDEPQSKRDLALAYQKNGEYQKALDLFYEVLIMDFDDETAGNWGTLDDLFPYFKSIVLSEFNNLISQHKNKLDLSEIYRKTNLLDKEDKKRFFKAMPVDIRIVLDWNTMETDIDLWVTEPTGETCDYGNSRTEIGGFMVEDMIDGYGSEEYILKDAMKGEYIIQVDFYDDRVQKIVGASTLKATIYFNYGSKNQTQKEIVFQLAADSEGEEIEIGRFEWKK